MKTRIIVSNRRFFQLSLVVITMLICGLFYERGLMSYSEEYKALDKQLTKLKQDHERALALNAELVRHVNSQSDPAWIEMTLIKGLGLTPEGHQKVLFLTPSE